MTSFVEPHRLIALPIRPQQLLLGNQGTLQHPAHKLSLQQFQLHHHLELINMAASVDDHFVSRR